MECMPMLNLHGQLSSLEALWEHSELTVDGLKGWAAAKKADPGERPVSDSVESVGRSNCV